MFMRQGGDMFQFMRANRGRILRTRLVQHSKDTNEVTKLLGCTRLSRYS